MQEKKMSSIDEFYQWSIRDKAAFWKFTSNKLGIKFGEAAEQTLDLSDGPTQPKWFPTATMNIAESCFNANPDTIALVSYSAKGQQIKWTYKDLQEQIFSIVNGIKKCGLTPGDAIAIDMPMYAESCAIYLAAVWGGFPVVTVADSFAIPEIKTRLDLGKPKLVFTQHVVKRGRKELALYDKVAKATEVPIVVNDRFNDKPRLAKKDMILQDFIGDHSPTESHKSSPEETITILFSSGTTGAPKAIPWSQTTPIKCASDAYYHHDIHEGEVICWPTNLGWMMGPWLLFATWINQATVALFEGPPLGKDFCTFIEMANVSMLGVIPSIVSQWRKNGATEASDWSHIRRFSSTGEVSSEEGMEWLMDLAGNKPVIEYCGGTEIGGGYITGSMLQAAAPGWFSTPAMGMEFMLVEEGSNVTKKQSDPAATEGEVFIVPPSIGLSTRLLNKDHHEAYYEGIEPIDGKLLRKHGDRLKRNTQGYYRAQGRTDDAMNLGGIKVGALQIEKLINSVGGIIESIAVAMPPKDGGPDQLYIAYTSTKQFGERELKYLCSSLLKNELNPLFKIRKMIRLKSLPRTASNKLIRKIPAEYV